MNVHNVKLSIHQSPSGNELAEFCYRTCSFCEKTVRLSPLNIQSSTRLAGKDFFCPACLRNNRHYKSARNVLILSYRAIIGSYYHWYYLKDRSLWLSEIQNYINAHARTGMQQPVFSYDPDTYLWFLDFNRIGNHPRHAPIEEVMETCQQILKCFDLNATSEKLEQRMWAKYSFAIDDFYRYRKRPQGRRMLIPSFYGEVPDSLKFHDNMRKFTATDLKIL